MSLHRSMLYFACSVAVATCLGIREVSSFTSQLTGHDRELMINHTMDKIVANGSEDVPRMREAVQKVYDYFSATWDEKTYSKTLHLYQMGLHQAKTQKRTYRYVQSGPHCDQSSTAPRVVKKVTGAKKHQFPGGILGRTFGFSFSKFMSGLTASGGGAGQSAGLATVAMSMGAGLVQSLAASVVHVVPPLVPPPAWNNKPIPCLPMITGHNCFGAILHPIAMADFIVADVTDSMLDGHIAGFPAKYAAKVGKTSDEMYKLCYGSYMSMQCASIFPRCTTPQSSSDLMPAGGRVPMCFFLCINTLVSCPGFWMDDIKGPCSLISVPPMCTISFYWKLWTLPPQYEDFSSSLDVPRDCPPSSELEVEPAVGTTVPSPIEQAAVAAAEVKLPEVKVHA